jgi:hypothetical protein
MPLAAALPLYPLFALVAITLASTAMFVWNVHRAAYQRRRLELKRWLRNHRMSETDSPPDPLPRLLPAVTWTRLLADANRTLASGHDANGGYHLLILRTPSPFPPTGLRPAAPTGSSRLLDSTPLRPYPSLPGTERFTTCGTTLHAARALADSPLRGLLPPDLGLLLDGNHLLLDFSSRPFDPLEFSRLLPLADQLAQNLPASSA